MKKVMSLVLFAVLTVGVAFGQAGGCKTKACQENCRNICGSDEVCYAQCVRLGDTSQIAEDTAKAAVLGVSTQF